MKLSSALAIATPILMMLGVITAVACGSDRPPVSDPGVRSPGGVQTGPCSTNGETVACDVETGRSGNVVNCFNGTQTCENGVWGPCGGTSGTLSTVNLPVSPDSLTAGEGSGSGGLSIQGVSFSDASSSSTGCVNNPCDPYCLGIDANPGDGGLVIDGGFSAGSIPGTTATFSSFPSAKCGAMAGQSGCVIGPGCQVFQPAPNDNECNYDYCCAHAADASTGSVGTCVQWIGDASACTASTNSNKIDYTVGVGCADTSGFEHFPVCNRGTADATTGKLLLYGYSSNPNGISTSASNNTCALPSSGSYSASCVINLATIPIAQGKCIDIDMGKAGQSPSQESGVTCDGTSLGSGNRSAMVNPPNVTIPNGASRTAYGSSGYTQLTEADACNNYTFVLNTTGNCAAYALQPPAPSTTTFTYTATCPSQTSPAWNQFAYDSSTPTQSDILFTATTQQVFSDGTTGTASSAVTLADPGAVGSTDSQVCAMSGPSPCPIDLATKLGSVNDRTAILNLTVTETAKTALPTLNSWSVSYNCLPAQ